MEVINGVPYEKWLYERLNNDVYPSDYHDEWVRILIVLSHAQEMHKYNSATILGKVVNVIEEYERLIL
jgi:hypothetical protein